MRLDAFKTGYLSLSERRDHSCHTVRADCPRDMSAPRVDRDDDLSSDDETEYTNVHLGLADGTLEASDAANPLVSRIAGRPVWLPVPAQKLPPSSVAQCTHCGQPMQLLTQIFAPLEGSAYDRNLLVWGCARAACQRKGRGR